MVAEVEASAESIAPAPASTLAAIEPATLTESTEIQEVPASDPTPLEIPLISLPSVLTVQESLDALEDAERSRLWSYDCNMLEEKDGSIFFYGYIMPAL